MNEKDNNFESLQQLLALKRHETPPPGYFSDFSGNVIARLRAGEGRAEPLMSGRLFEEAPWLARFLQIFEAKPVFVGGFSAALCLLLLGGIIYNNREDATPESPIFSTAVSPVPAAASVALAQPTSLAVATDNSGPAGGLAVTTNYSLQPVAAMFGQQNFFTQPQEPVSFTPSGN